MKAVFYLSTIIICLLFSVSGCKRGCTDKIACNYDEDAKKDDGTCNYGCLQLTNTPSSPGTSNCTVGEKKFNDILSEITINNFDNTIGSPYQGKVFSSLTITQNRYQTCHNGQMGLNGHTENILSFRNVTNYSLTFDFVITQNYNGNHKQYQGFIQGLKPNETRVINTGDGTFYNLNHSQVQVAMATVSYE